MTATEFIKMNLTAASSLAMTLLSDMQDAPLVQPTSNGGNHPTWLLGHLAYVQSMFFDEMIRGQPNRFPELETQFGVGSIPTTDAEQYPSMDELFSKFEQTLADTSAYLDTLTDSELDNPSHVESGYEQYFGTIGKCCGAMVSHISFHTGQVAVTRRAAGRKPLLA